MTAPDRWRRVEDLYHAALDLPAGERPAFVRDSCAGDDALQREIESLLAYEDGAQGFMAAPALEVLPGEVNRPERMRPGHRFGHYEVVSFIGAGGMGDVYRARDTKLMRDVAIKILPDVFAGDGDRRARFEREARLLAALNHPHVAAIHGFEHRDGIDGLVLELVEGATLAALLRTGPLPIPEVLAIGRQLADALEAAHDKGIVHRDLKPANIAITPEGIVKVLDFGLAKARGDDAASHSANSPTLSTAHHVVLGTAAYMSPEQVSAKPVDRRTDLWAFGCILYEMLSGKRAFAGASVAETVAAVIKSTPDWHALPSATPEGLRRLVRRCLAKDPKGRIADASTARLEIDDALAGNESPDSDDARTVTGGHRRRELVVWSAAAVFLLAAVVSSVIAFVRPATDGGPVFHAVIPAPDNTVIGITRGPGISPSKAFSIALSPDGRHLVFLATGADGVPRLWLRRLDGGSAQALEGTEYGLRPFWSPDSRSVAFFVEDKLNRVEIGGGPVLTVCENPGALNSGAGGTWNADGVILFAPTLVPGTSAPLYRVAASGGVPVPVTTIDVAGGDDVRDWAPAFLPDGQHFLYTKTSTNTGSSVYVASLDRPEGKLLLEGVASARYAQGQLLFLRGTTLMAQRFDAARGVLSGPVAPIAEAIAIDPTSRTGLFSVSNTGVLAYQRGAAVTLSQLTWLDRAGWTLGVLGEPADYNTVTLSPDDSYAAVTVRDVGGNMNVWIADLARGVRTRFTSDRTSTTQAVWSPDGSQIAFDAMQDGRRDLFRRPATGSQIEDVIAAPPVNGFATSWSADGNLLLFHSPAGRPPTGNDIWVVPLRGDKQPYTFLKTPFHEARAQFAPDDRWVAYQSNESGRFEVYVAPFPGPGGKWQVSTAGGFSARWRGDGKELFYITPDGQLMAATVNGAGSAFEVGAVRALFDLRIRDQALGTPYDVTSDGQRFLVNALAADSLSSSITLVVNWPGLLAR